jgi:hypothetical protein
MLIMKSKRNVFFALALCVASFAVLSNVEEPKSEGNQDKQEEKEPVEFCTKYPKLCIVVTAGNNGGGKIPPN